MALEPPLTHSPASCPLLAWGLVLSCLLRCPWNHSSTRLSPPHLHPKTASNLPAAWA